jgi:hypothetical protein
MIAMIAASAKRKLVFTAEDSAEIRAGIEDQPTLAFFAARFLAPGAESSCCPQKRRRKLKQCAYASPQ